MCLLACSFLPSFLPSCQSCALALLLPCCCRRDKQARNSESRCPMTSSLSLYLSSPVNFLSLALPCSFCLCVRSFCVYLSLFHCLLHSHTHSHTYYLLAFSFSLSLFRDTLFICLPVLRHHHLKLLPVCLLPYPLIACSCVCLVHASVFVCPLACSCSSGRTSLSLSLLLLILRQDYIMVLIFLSVLSGHVMSCLSMPACLHLFSFFLSKPFSQSLYSHLRSIVIVFIVKYQ